MGFAWPCWAEADTAVTPSNAKPKNFETAFTGSSFRFQGRDGIRRASALVPEISTWRYLSIGWFGLGVVNVFVAALYQGGLMLQRSPPPLPAVQGAVLIASCAANAR